MSGKSMAVQPIPSSNELPGIVSANRGMVDRVRSAPEQIPPQVLSIATV